MNVFKKEEEKTAAFDQFVLIGNANGIDTAVSLTRYPRWFGKQNKLPEGFFFCQ